jgi:hypothetical protein
LKSFLRAKKGRTKTANDDGTKSDDEREKFIFKIALSHGAPLSFNDFQLPSRQLTAAISMPKKKCATKKFPIHILLFSLVPCPRKSVAFRACVAQSFHENSFCVVFFLCCAAEHFCGVKKGHLVHRLFVGN